MKVGLESFLPDESDNSENDPAESTTTKNDPFFIDLTRYVMNKTKSLLLSIRSSLSKKQAVMMSADLMDSIVELESIDGVAEMEQLLFALKT